MSVVCIHLARKESRQWIPVTSGSDYPDWLCADICVTNYPDIPNDHLMTLCQQCIQELRAEFS